MVYICTNFRPTSTFWPAPHQPMGRSGYPCFIPYSGVYPTCVSGFIRLGLKTRELSFLKCRRKNKNGKNYEFWVKRFAQPLQISKICLHMLLGNFRSDRWNFNLTSCHSYPRYALSLSFCCSQTRDRQTWAEVCKFKGREIMGSVCVCVSVRINLGSDGLLGVGQFRAQFVIAKLYIFTFLDLE